MSKPKIAIICDWLTNNGGAEQVIRTLHQMFPQAPIYTTLYNSKKCSGFENATIHTSFLQKIPILKKKHQILLSLMPLAIESFNLDKYDIIISSSHSVAKGVITKPSTIHICYCHTPMRYAWEQWELESRIKNFPKLIHNRIRKQMHKLRIWDRLSAERVDHFIANSSYVAQRIKKYYRKKSTVINPPVDTNQFKIQQTPSSELQAQYFFMVGRLIAYKKFDLAIQAFNQSGRNLIIAGDGPEMTHLKSIAGPTIQLLGRIPQAELIKLYSECQAFIFPGLEDFGITPIEAMASGRPVIAYKAGGALDYITYKKTGIFHESQTVESLNSAVNQYEAQAWNPKLIKEHAENFSTNNFKKYLIQYIQNINL